jgi:hypothetical protein
VTDGSTKVALITPVQVNVQHELADGRTMPILDCPANEGQERNGLSQMDADFGIFYILLHINLMS